jgi:CBS domain-containing protein
VVSEADLLAKQRYPHGSDGVGILEGWRHQAELHKAEGATAAELMGSPPVTVLRSASVAAAARLLAGWNVRRLPVVDDTGRPVGIVGRADLLKVFLRDDEELRREVADEVAPGAWAPAGTIRVAVTDGVVTLRGQVERRSHVGVLVRMVEAVDGVVRVDPQLSWEVDDTVPPVAVVPEGSR